jgi:hypothetical protein
MKNLLKSFIRPFIPQSLINRFKHQLTAGEIDQWKKSPTEGPAPHVVKQETIAEYQKEFGYEVLIETGTYLGDMVEAQKLRFNKIISIELGEDLFKDAQKRFKNDRNITIVQGDSGKVLPQVLQLISESAVFWLDGHYSAGITAKGLKECPIYEELDAILSNSKYKHVLLIDDARCFNGTGDYPTIESLTEFVQKYNPNYKLEIKYDIIRYAIY